MHFACAGWLNSAHVSDLVMIANKHKRGALPVPELFQNPVERVYWKHAPHMPKVSCKHQNPQRWVLHALHEENPIAQYTKAWLSRMHRNVMP